MYPSLSEPLGADIWNWEGWDMLYNIHFMLRTTVVTSAALNGISCPPSVTPSPLLRAPRGSQLTNHLRYVPSSSKKKNSILTPSCRPDHACASCLLLQHSISHHARASRAPPTRPTRQPAPPSPPPSPPSPPSPPRSGALHVGRSFPCCSGQESLLTTSDCWF